MNIRDLENDIAGMTKVVRSYIRSIRMRLHSLERALDEDSVLNSMGELQQLGPQLDAAVATLATLKNIKDKVEEDANQEA